MPDFHSTLIALGEGKVKFKRLCARIEELLEEHPQLAENMLRQLEHVYVDRLLSVQLHDSVKRHIVRCQTNMGQMQAGQRQRPETGRPARPGAVIAISPAVPAEQLAPEEETAQDVRAARVIADTTGTEVPELSDFLPPAEIGGAPVLSGTDQERQSGVSDEPPSSKSQPPRETGARFPFSSFPEQPPEKDEGGAETLDVGSVIRGRFKLLEVIGQSGMGKVFKCIDLLKQEARDKNPYVAIKLLNEVFRKHPEAFIALERESSRQQRLTHPNITAVYDFDRVGAAGSQVYILMELLEGMPLDVYIRRTVAPNGGLPLKEAFPIIEGLGKALEYIHEQNIIHADLKPGNCYLLHDKSVKLLDFGIARALTDPLAEDHTRTLFDASELGALTPAYASKEMLEEKNADPRDDIYALGCVAYELLTGEHPFGKVPANIAHNQNLTLNPVKGLNQYQMQALTHALAFERKDRSINITAWLDELEGKLPYETPMRQREYQAWIKAQDPTKQRKRPWKSWAAAAAAAIFLAGLYPAMEYRRHQQIDQVIKVLEQGDHQAIIQTLETLDQYRADERQRILDIAGYTLQRHFHMAVEETAMPEQGRYDFPQAERMLEQAELFYSDTPWLTALSLKTKERKAALIEQLSEQYDAHLAAGKLLADNRAEEITDVLEILASAAPGHPLLKDPRLVAAYRRAADEACRLDKPQQALDYILPALAIAPGDRDLRELKNKAETLMRTTGPAQEEARREFAGEERVKLGVLIAQPRAGDGEWEEQVRSNLWRLDGLLPPDDPTPKRARDHIAEIYLPAVQRAVAEQRFADARGTLNRVEQIIGKTELLETTRADIEQALEKSQRQLDGERSGQLEAAKEGPGHLHLEAAKESSGQLEALKVTLLTQLIDRDLTAARTILRALQKALPGDDPFLARAYLSFENIYLQLAAEAALQDGRGAALALLQEGAELMPNASRLAKARQEYAPTGGTPGTHLRDCDICPEMAVLPPGSFRMGNLNGEGSEDELPVREVSIPYSFAVSIHEVTVAEFNNFQKVPETRFSQTGSSPVVNVSWNEALAYTKWLSAKTGKPYRLLTEAEWEYAARAGTTTKYAFGNDLNAGQANAYGAADGHAYTAEVGSFSANDFGLHDMHGNVWEWVSDCWNSSYRGAPADSAPWNTGDCQRRVVRGGSWDSEPRYLRSANRNRNNTADRHNYIGFRVAKTLEPGHSAAP